MKNYCVVQHSYSEFLGLIESQLEKRDIGFSYYRPFVGQDSPGRRPSLTACGCSVVPGRPRTMKKTRRSPTSWR